MYCPEAFFSVVAEKLVYTATMFVQVELLNEFFYQFPREVDNRLYYGLKKDQVLTFAQENPDMKQQLALLDRKTKLELVMEKLSYLSRARQQQQQQAQEDLRWKTSSPEANA
jgi:hypothetical protein